MRKAGTIVYPESKFEKIGVRLAILRASLNLSQPFVLPQAFDEFLFGQFSLAGAAVADRIEHCEAFVEYVVTPRGVGYRTV